MESLRPAAARVQALLKEMGLEAEVVEFAESTRSSAEAAAQVGCDVAQIAKSLVFRAKASDRAVLVMASGANRVDEKAVAALLGEKIGKADADFVRDKTGYAIGGVAPVGHAARPVTFIDEDLLAYETIWAAAGTPFAVFRLTPEELIRLTGGARRPHCPGIHCPGVLDDTGLAPWLKIATAIAYLTPQHREEAAMANEPDSAAEGPSGGPQDHDPADHAIEAALRLAAERGWRDLALIDIAQAAEMSLAELYGLYPSKQAILDAYLRRIDRAVLAETEAPEGTAKDRLFDVLMRRLDKLEPHKAGLERIGEDSARDPLAVICGLGRLERSMAAMLEAAGISAGGLAGVVRTKGLSAVYLRALRTWFRDDTTDKSKTMAVLDKALGRAERLAGGLGRRRSAES